MADEKDPAIKLFGWTIPVVQGGNNKEDGKMDEFDTSTKSQDKEQEFPISDEQKHPISSVLEGDAQKLLQSEEKAPATNSPEKQPVKKPDKILPCPRCSSLDTKFCYYNNYNVNQPRHFCKNCQRYWTAGGTMRNVPVGAGRRKSKSSHNRHITVTASALQTLCSDGPESIHHLPVSPNSTVLTFGPDRTLCESMASVLNLPENATEKCNWNAIHQTEETGDEHSSGSSVTGSNSNEEGVGATSQQQMLRNCQAIPTPWSYPWASAPPFCSPSFPVPFYPAVAAYWGCGIQGAWTVPWIAPLPSPPANVSSSLPNSPTLGKHSREGIVLKRSNSKAGEVREKSKQEGGIWVPKTLRIDDPEVAAKSSIWASIGIENDKTDSIGRGSLFKEFQDKATESKDQMSQASQVLCANPAALSRSLNFQES